ncbi:MAG: transporter permease [Candidatus Saccharibacteria bacterium]|nr:transporter permease [Candidatus Saccharibacteria bacterium]
MNVVSRGIRNALRSPLRSGAIVIMLAISITLIVAMLVARSSVNAKIEEVKGSTANQITINPAGIRGGFGGGDPLTAEQVTTVTSTAHIGSVASTLTDQAGTDDTNLTPSLELGSFGQRMQRFETSTGDSNGPTDVIQGDGSSDSAPARPARTPRTTITGTTDANSIASDGSTLTLTSGATVDSTSSDLVALVGKTLAEKNSLSVGSTFTLYGKTFTVNGIYETGNTFQDSGIVVPLATLQTATEQPGAVTSAVATVDSSENVTATVSALKTALGDKADITSSAEQAETSVASLRSISSLATTGVVGATIAGAVIVLLTMTMIVRERRREIGVIKAIGGTTSKVITQFVTEALTLTLVSGVIGIALGIFVSGSITDGLVTSASAAPKTTQGQGPMASAGGMRGTGGPTQRFNQGLQQVTSTVTPQIFMGAAGITLLIAILGSALPAYLIARVRPAEVLRTE